MRRRHAYRPYVAGRLFLRPSEFASYPRECLSKVRLGTVRVAKGWIKNGFHESLRHVWHAFLDCAVHPDARPDPPSESTSRGKHIARARVCHEPRVARRL